MVIRENGAGAHRWTWQSHTRLQGRSTARGGMTSRDPSARANASLRCSRTWCWSKGPGRTLGSAQLQCSGCSHWRWSTRGTCPCSRACHGRTRTNGMPHGALCHKSRKCTIIKRKIQYKLQMNCWRSTACKKKFLLVLRATAHALAREKH